MIATSPLGPSPGDGEAAAARGTEILRALGLRAHGDPEQLARGIQPEGSDPFSPRLCVGLETLLWAVRLRRGELARDAGRALIGAGPGLTPLGDDYLAGAAHAVTALGGCASFGEADRARWLDALLSPSPDRLTTPVSAALLEAARRGRAAEPLHDVLDLSRRGRRRLRPALAELTSIGATSGRGCAAAIGASAVLLASGAEPAAPKRQPTQTGGRSRT